MEDKTIIIRPPKPEEKKPAQAAVPHPVAAKPLAQTQSAKSVPKPPVPKSEGGKMPGGVMALAAAALLLIGVSTSLLTVYMLGGDKSANLADETTITEAELENELTPVPDENSEASDKALIESVIGTGVIELSGDPVIVRQVQGKTRQLLALNQETQKSAASALGAHGPVFRLTDMLDSAGADIGQGVLGSQDDIALFQDTAFAPKPDETDPLAENADTGTSVLTIELQGTGLARQEFAKQIKDKSTVAAELTGFGLDPNHAKDAELALAGFYDLKGLRDKDAIAVVGAKTDDAPDMFVPVQVSVYREDELIGTVALNDVNIYTKGVDPWYQRDIFAAQLLPEETAGGKKQRLLDAIYAVALRNGLPAAVAGETIMMMSRAHDLEQQVESGDSIAILYSTAARDPKTGFGRVIYVRVARASTSLECFVFQAQQGQQFECISSEGGSNIAAAGVIMPVNGTVVAKFGSPSEGVEGTMNFGVDLAAPKGTPVIASAAGTIATASAEKELGNVIRLTHDDGGESTYGYLQRFATGIKSGSKIAAGQTIGYVGNPPFSRDPRLHFELRRNGEPVDPMNEVQASVGVGSVGAGSAVDIFVNRIIQVESANRCDAKNPLSTAMGLGQFIEGTWMTTIALHRPDLLKMGRARVLALRTNCELARAMTTAFTRDNASVIRSRGHPVTPGHLYLAHFLGVGGALKVLGSSPNQQIAAVFGEHHVRANPFERGKSIGYLVNWAAKKMGGKSSARPDVPGAKVAAATKPATTGATESVAAAPAEKMVRYAGDEKFAALKKNVALLMQ